MSQENGELVRRAIAALNDRDLDGYLACCTPDVRLRTWLVGGDYDGPVGVRRFFTDVYDTAPDFCVTIERVEPIGEDRVLAFVHLAATARTTNLAMERKAANVYEIVDAKIDRIRIFLHRDEALKAVGLEE